MKIDDFAKVQIHQLSQQKINKAAQMPILLPDAPTVSLEPVKRNGAFKFNIRF